MTGKQMVSRIFLVLFLGLSLLAGGACLDAGWCQEEEEEPIQARPRPDTKGNPMLRGKGVSMEGHDNGKGPSTPVQQRSSGGYFGNRLQQMKGGASGQSMKPASPGGFGGRIRQPMPSWDPGDRPRSPTRSVSDDGEHGKGSPMRSVADDGEHGKGSPMRSVADDGEHGKGSSMRPAMPTHTMRPEMPSPDMHRPAAPMQGIQRPEMPVQTPRQQMPRSMKR